MEVRLLHDATIAADKLGIALTTIAYSTATMMASGNIELCQLCS
jgi:hypothetical protein